MAEKQFRFQDFEIWQKGAAISGPLFELADELDSKRFYRFGEQLRAATTRTVLWPIMKLGSR